MFIKYFVISKILKYIPDSGFPLVPVCVYTMAGQTPALQQNWQSPEKSHHFKEHTILRNTLYNTRMSTLLVYGTFLSKWTSEHGPTQGNRSVIAMLHGHIFVYPVGATPKEGKGCGVFGWCTPPVVVCAARNCICFYVFVFLSPLKHQRKNIIK